MLAARRIDALVPQSKSLDGYSTDDVRFDDLGHIFWLHASVPDGVWIDDHIWAMLALIEASCLVCPHCRLQSSRTYCFFESLVQLSTAVGIATASRTSGLALIGANKYVVLEPWHG